MEDGRRQQVLFKMGGKPRNVSCQHFGQSEWHFHCCPGGIQSQARNARRCATGLLVLANFNTWALLAAYFPQGKRKTDFFSECNKIALGHEKLPFAILGDFNTGNQLMDRSASGSPYVCAALFDDLTEKTGLVDLWRHANGTDIREWTWLSHRGNGFRLDHAFGNRKFIEQCKPTCLYDHTPRQGKITDHSAIIISRTHG